MSGTDHDPIDWLARSRTGREQPRQRIEDPARDIGCGRSFDCSNYLPILDQDRIRVGTANVDSDAPHQAKTGL
jgi:hypothetical protein